MRGREAAIGNLIADAMRERSRADAAIMNGGGIRGGKVYEPGAAITRRDVQAELPFGNHLVALDVKGSDLRLALENGLSRLPAAAGRFPQVSGMTVEFDPQRPAGSRVLAITVGGAPLDAEQDLPGRRQRFHGARRRRLSPSPRSIRWCRSKTRRCWPTR